MRLHGVRQSSLPVSRGQAPPVNRPASSIAVNAVSRGPPDKTVDCNTKNVALAQPVGTPVEATVEAMQGRAGEDGGTGETGGQAGDDGEQWRSVFDDEGSSGDTSNEEKRG